MPTKDNKDPTASAPTSTPATSDSGPILSNDALSQQALAVALRQLNDSQQTNVQILALVEKITTQLTGATKDPLEQWDAQSDRFRQKIRDRPCHDETVIKDAVSPWTGATMDVVVQSRRDNSEGVVIRLDNYRYPEWSLKPIAEGGKVSNDLKINKSDGGITPEYGMWRWLNTFQMDLKNMVGLPPHPALKTSGGPASGSPPAHAPVPASVQPTL